MPTLSFEQYHKRSYIPELDGVRALSVLMVISVHMYDSGRMWFWLAGGQGVTLFFVLSGYLITSLGLREESRRGRVHLGAFYVRRSFRLFPLYYLVLGFYCTVVGVLGFSPHLRDTLLEALPYYLTYLQEVPFYTLLVQGHQDLPLFHTWSLGVEEKFYLIWPMLAFVGWRAAVGPRLRGTVALIALLVLTIFLLPIVNPSFKNVSRYLTGYVAILLGCLLAQLLHVPQGYSCLRWLGNRNATFMGLAGLLVLHFLQPWVPSFLLQYDRDLLYSLAAMFLLGSLLLGEGSLQRMLRWQPLVIVGKLSYGIYLIHVLAIVVAHRIAPSQSSLVMGLLAYLLACGLATGGAWVLALTVEQPCIALGRRWSRWLVAQPERDAPREMVGWQSTDSTLGTPQTPTAIAR